MESYHALLIFSLGLLALLNPIGNAAIYMGLVAKYDAKHKRKTAIICGISITIILLIAIWVGWVILSFFGISIGSFKAAGGLIVILIALSMVQGHAHTHTYDQKGNKEPPCKGSIAVVPMAMPIIAGPGALAFIISHTEHFPSISEKLAESVIAMIMGTILFLVLLATPYIGKALGESGMKIVTRVMGLILLAIAVQMFAGGLGEMLPGLAHY